MSSIRRVGLLTLGVAVMCCAGFYNHTQAQDAERGFTVSPPIFELSANPGDTKREVINLYNQGDADLTLAVTIQDMRPMGEVGQVQLITDDKDEKLPSLKNWIALEQDTVALKTKQTTEVGFTIDIPENVAPGGHFASIVFTATAASGGGAAAVSSGIGTLILLTTSGDVDENAAISEFATVRKIYWQSNDKVDFNLKVKNDGNVYIKPRGYLLIKNVFGRQVAQVEVGDKNILPGATRQIPAEFQGKRLFGPYTVTLTMQYGDASSKNINGSAVFWIVPWWQTLTIVLILLMIVFGRKRLWLTVRTLFGKNKNNRDTQAPS